MKIYTESANAVLRALHNQSGETMLDAACKEVLAIKGVLARILKECVPEYKDIAVKDIATKYIEGEPLVARIGVSPDETGADLQKYWTEMNAEAAPITKGELLSGSNTEITSPQEGKVTFDIFFWALVPVTGEMIRFYVDLEAQNNTTPGYPLVKRAIFNGCRVISAQKGIEFDNDDYKNIKKCYGIWICPRPPKKKRGTITRYFMQEKCIVGASKENKSSFDLLDIWMMYLPDADGKEGDGILRMLDKLLSRQISVEEKLDTLKNDFGVPITKTVERRVRKMCDYSALVKEEGREDLAEESALRMYSDGISIEKIAQYLEYTTDAVKKWLGFVPE